MHTCMVSNVCPFSFSLPVTLYLPPRTLDSPFNQLIQLGSQQTSTRMKNNFSCCSDRTASICRCCYECHQSVSLSVSRPEANSLHAHSRIFARKGKPFDPWPLRNPGPSRQEAVMLTLGRVSFPCELLFAK